MKRILTISMLLIANIIILAHAVVPHHHHDKVAVAILHLWAEDSEHHHSHYGETHHHDGHEDCLLTEVLEEALVRDAFDEIEPFLKSAQLQPLHFFISDTIFADVIPNAETLLYLRHPFRQRPYLRTIYFSFAANQFGFRAPPFC